MHVIYIYKEIILPVNFDPLIQAQRWHSQNWRHLFLLSRSKVQRNFRNGPKLSAILKQSIGGILARSRYRRNRLPFMRENGMMTNGMLKVSMISCQRMSVATSSKKLAGRRRAAKHHKSMNLSSSKELR